MSVSTPISQAEKPYTPHSQHRNLNRSPPVQKQYRSNSIAELEAKIRDSVIIDTRIRGIRPLLPPACLLEELPTSPAIQHQIVTHRLNIANIIHGEDDRLLVVVGPCSIHDVEAAIEYGERLKPLLEKYSDTLFIAMR